MTSNAAMMERAITDARDGTIGFDAMLTTLLAGTFVVPSGGPVEADGAGFEPVLFDKAGTPMVAAFTSTDRIGEVGKTAPYALSMPARAFLERVPSGHGVVVNPGHPAGFDIDPTGLVRLIRDSAAQ